MPEGFYELAFPLAGLDLFNAFSRQLPRQMPVGEWGRTCREGVNVRSYDPATDRARGGQRAGLVKYTPAIVPDWTVQHLDVTVGMSEGQVATQLSQSGRVVTLVAVSQGNVYTFTPGGMSWKIADNQTGQDPPVNYTGIMFTATLNQMVWFADGNNWAYYDPRVNAVFPWVASSGVLPVDQQGNTPRLICAWRGRIVLSGLLYDPQNWFMSAVGDPTNFDYAPLDLTPTQAIAGNNSPLGIVGDVITALIPYSDDVLIFGGDSTIYILQGDPMAGGQIDLVTKSIGMAWGQAWCQDPYGTIYFVSNRCGIYSFVPGQQPVRISQPVEQLIADIDTGLTTIRLLWNDRFQGLHVFLTPTRAPAPTRHLFWEMRSGSWWQDQFADPNFDPLCCATFDGNLPGDRVALIGSWDGYVRSVSTTALDDDGLPIDSAVVLGPINAKTLDDFLLKDLQAVLGESSGQVGYAVHVGSTAEIALSNAPVATGTWGAGRNLDTHIRRAGHAVYVRLTASNPWALEVIRARVDMMGKVRRRGPKTL